MLVLLPLFSWYHRSRACWKSVSWALVTDLVWCQWVVLETFLVRKNVTKWQINSKCSMQQFVHLTSSKLKNFLQPWSEKWTAVGHSPNPSHTNTVVVVVETWGADAGRLNTGDETAKHQEQELAPETSLRPENSHYCRSSGNYPAVSGRETEFLLMSSGVESFR